MRVEFHRVYVPLPLCGDQIGKYVGSIEGLSGFLNCSGIGKDYIFEAVVDDFGNLVKVFGI